MVVAVGSTEDGGEGARAADLEERRGGASAWAREEREKGGKWASGRRGGRGVGEAQTLSPRPDVAGEAGPAGTVPL